MGKSKLRKKNTRAIGYESEVNQLRCFPTYSRKKIFEAALGRIQCPPKKKILQHMAITTLSYYRFIQAMTISAPGRVPAYEIHQETP